MKNLIISLLASLIFLFLANKCFAFEIEIKEAITSPYFVVEKPPEKKILVKASVQYVVGSARYIIKRVFDNVFGDSYWPDTEKIINKESGFNPYAWNVKSGAGGIFQALPYSKTGCEMADIQCQAIWGAQYIKSRYKNPSSAWSFWQLHGWY